MQHWLSIRDKTKKFLHSDAGWVIGVFCVWRIALTLWAGWVSPSQALPPEVQRNTADTVYRTYRLAQPWVSPLATFLLDPWYRWDAGWHLGTALGDPESVSGFAPPLYPLLIRLAAPLTFGNLLAAGLLVSNTSFLVALILLFNYVRQAMGPEKARLAVLVMVTFPFSLFFSSVYGEALFLGLVLATFAALRAQRWGWVGLWAALAGLTRFVGIVLIVPLGWEAIRLWRSHDPKKWLALGAALAGPLTTLLYSIGLRALQTTLPSARFVQELVWPWESLEFLLHKLLYGPMWAMDWVCLFVLGLGLLSCRAMLKRLPLADGLYVLSSLAVISLLKVNGNLLIFNVTRYVLVLFPLFAIWAEWLAFKRWRLPLVLVSGSVAQLGVVWLYTHWLFVG